MTAKAKKCRHSKNQPDAKRCPVCDLCRVCGDLGFVRIGRTKEVVPCPTCNEDGSDEITG